MNIAFEATRGAQKDIMGARNISVLVVKFKSQFLELMEMEMISWAIYMTMY
jgi:hypothetical protein